MAVLQMQKVSICGLKKDRKEILDKLQSMAVMEISSALEEDDVFQKKDVTNAKNSFDKMVQAAEQALTLLQEYAPEKSSLLSSLEGKTVVAEDRYNRVIEHREDILKTIKHIQALDKERAEHKAEIVKLENYRESIRPWLSLDLPVNFENNQHSAMVSGMMPGTLNLAEIQRLLAQKRTAHIAVDIHIVSRSNDYTYVAFFVLKKDSDEMEEVLRSRGFVRLYYTWNKTPQNTIDEIDSKIEKESRKIALIDTEVAELATYREKIRIFADYHRIRSDKYIVLGQILQSKSTFIISGYVPIIHVDRVRQEIEANYDCAVDIQPVKDSEEVPTLLENNAFSESLEGIVASYGLPGKGEIDPTFLTSIFYIVFFGMMLADLAYGAIVAGIVLVVHFKYPGIDRNMRKTLKMFLWCGVSSMVWGILFGEFFGNLIQIVSGFFFGREVILPALWFAPLDDPMRLLMFSFLIGLIHVFIGLAVKGYLCLRDKRVGDFICEVVMWYVLLAGLLILLIPSEIFASIAGFQVEVSEFVSGLGVALSVIGAFGIVLFSARKSRNPVMRVAKGTYNLYGVTQWLSDLLSYSRLLALGLASGVIASVVNEMGVSFGTGAVGIALFIIVAILGHTLNLALSLLSAYVHTNRLQFVEFFGKFYEGTGRAFIRFERKTKYIEVREEKE